MGTNVPESLAGFAPATVVAIRGTKAMNVLAVGLLFVADDAGLLVCW